MNSDIITSLDNSNVKEARSLNDKKFRRNYGKFLIDGEKLVYEAVCGAVEIDKIFVEESKVDHYDYILKKFDGKVIKTSAKVFASISESVTPQGIIAEVFMNETGEFNPPSGEPFIILDRIQDPGNLGTIIRTAAATGYETVVLIGTVDAYSPKVIRSSSGGILYLDIYRMREEEILDYCQNNGIELLVADMDGVNIFKTKITNRNYALVIGNEGQGVSQNFKEMGRSISLPMKSQMESLNAAVSASVLMYTLKGDEI